MMTRTVLCFGDSNTHGTAPVAQFGVSQRHPFADRWPNVMAQALGEGWHVINEGHGGRTTVHDDPVEGVHRNGARMLLALLESHRPLDVVIIMLGTNDLKARFGVSAREIASSVERLVAINATSAAGPSGKPPDILVVTPTPILETGVLADMFRGGAIKSQGLQTAFADMAERIGVAHFDAGSVCTVSAIDGIHFDAQALHALGNALADQVKKLAQ